jgi:hypothetical protein
VQHGNGFKRRFTNDNLMADRRQIRAGLVKRSNATVQTAAAATVSVTPVPRAEFFAGCAGSAPQSNHHLTLDFKAAFLHATGQWSIGS